MREAHFKNPALKRKREFNILAVQEGDFGLKDAIIKDDLREIKEAFKSMKLIPLKVLSTMCLFCLGDNELSFVTRIASFAHIDSLRRLVDDLYLYHYDQDVSVVCPHSLCDTSFQNVDYFKNHVATVHNVFLSK